MLNNTEILLETKQAPIESKDKPSRKPYHKPQLEEMGDLRTLTLGASPSGFPDSGVGLFEDFP